MRALTLAAPTGLEQLAVREVPAPGPPAAHDVRIAVRAAALNRLDLFVAHGLPGIELQYPHIVGTDGAGVVESVGSAVTHVRPGERVMINPGISCGNCEACERGEEPLCDQFAILGEHRAGAAAEFVVVPAVNVAPVPESWSWAEAAAYPLATLTAWRMLVTRAGLQPGETVLVWGAGGGVAQAAIGIAAHLGAEVIATSSSDAKLEQARTLGAAHVVNHASADLAAEVKRITRRRGANVVVETVGEATWERSQRCLARLGRIVICGATSGPHIGLDLRRLFWRQWSILGSTMGSRSEFAEIVALAHAGKLRARVDSVVPLAQSRAAYDRLERGEQSGKLVIEVAS